MYICATLVCLVSTEARKGHWIPWNCSYRWLCVAMLVQEIESCSSKMQQCALTAGRSIQPQRTFIFPFAVQFKGHFMQNAEGGIASSQSPPKENKLWWIFSYGSCPFCWHSSYSDVTVDCCFSSTHALWGKKCIPGNTVPIYLDECKIMLLWKWG